MCIRDRYTKVQIEDCQEIFEKSVQGNETIERLLYQKGGKVSRGPEDIPFIAKQTDVYKRQVLSQEKFEADGGQGDVEGWLNTITIENVHPNTTVAIRMKGISGETGSLKLYAYGTDGTLKEVPAEKWHIQTEDGETPDTLSEDVLYEVHMIVEDGGDFDLSETEKEIKISAVLGA